MKVMGQFFNFTMVKSKFAYGNLCKAIVDGATTPKSII